MYCLYLQAYCAWKTAQDGALVRYRVLTEAEHQLLRSTRDRSDAYLLGEGAAAGAGTAPAAAPGAAVAALKAAGAAAAAKGATIKSVSISVTAVAAGAGAGSAAGAQGQPNVDMAMVVGGQDAVKVAGFNYQLAYGSQSPVTALPASDKGFHDVFGNAWEWAEDHFAAFHGEHKACCRGGGVIV
jgi:formylglycine-generating enzyme required for sulfatase activity